jgi:hypothetical protein
VTHAHPTRILPAFPDPPPLVLDAFTVLTVVASGDQDAVNGLGDITDLPRPWDPATCPPPMRHHLWLWLDDVATWFNATYAERPATMIPACWPAHPHLAAELAVLASLRQAAAGVTSVDALDEWHRYAVPAFIDRMAARLGDVGCRTGRHIDWPGAARHDHNTSTHAVTTRLEAYHADTQPGRAAPRDRSGRRPQPTPEARSSTAT